MHLLDSWDFVQTRMDRFIQLFSDILLFTVVMTFLFTFLVGIVLTVVNQLRTNSGVSIFSVFKLTEDSPKPDVSVK